MYKLKKGSGYEVRFFILAVVFVTVLSIGNLIFLDDAKKDVFNREKDDETLTQQVLNEIDKLFSGIPAIGPVYNFITAGFRYDYIHPWITILIEGLFTIPLIYVLVRIFRGGG